MLFCFLSQGGTCRLSSDLTFFFFFFAFFFFFGGETAGHHRILWICDEDGEYFRGRNA